VSRAAPRAVILDRDGTIIVDHGYLDDPERVQFLPHALAGLQLWQAHGHPLIIVSNQSGLGRGKLRLEQVQAVNARLLQMSAAAGVQFAGLYFCPHSPEAACACRKPNTQLVLEAAAQLGFDPEQAVVVGDKSSDIELGRRLQALTVLVSADGRAADGLWVEPHFVVRDLLEAARLTVAQQASAAPGHPVG
jgi:D-glycero-D-manno-heptose 1,7-bisphosphate phosphatase